MIGTVSAAVVREVVRLRPGVHSASTPDGTLHLVGWPRAERLGRLTAGQTAALAALAADDHTAEDLVRAGVRHDGPNGAAHVDALLAKLWDGTWLVRTVTADDGAYTLRPRAVCRPAPPHPGAGTQVLSRFATLRPDGGAMLLESPLANHDIELHGPRLTGVLATLACPGAERPEPGLASRFVADLAFAGFLTGPDGTEDGVFSTAQWSPHELRFHDLSRQHPDQRVGVGFGGTSWAAGRFAPLPGRHESFGPGVVDLPVPDLAGLRAMDRPFTDVLEARRSIRSYDDDHPLTAGQLGEFLFRCARVRATDSSDGVEVCDRPYPTGGALHELEVYAVVRLVTGVAPGLYHYDGFEHRLEPVGGHPSAVGGLLARSSTAMAGGVMPQVLFVVAARFGRLMWKYEGMAYALVLKHVGVLCQTMYLVATAMGLAPCALGTGDSDLFAYATGLDYVAESSVGEFALGSRP